MRSITGWRPATLLRSSSRAGQWKARCGCCRVMLMNPSRSTLVMGGRERERSATRLGSTLTNLLQRTPRARVWGFLLTLQRHGYQFANTQHTQTMEERDPFRVGTLAEYHQRPEFARPEDQRVADGHSMFPLWNYNQHKWGCRRPDGVRRVRNACTIAYARRGKQHSGGGKRRDQAKGRSHELDSRGSLLQRADGRSANVFSTGAVHALRERAVRAGLPEGCGNGSQRRRLE